LLEKPEGTRITGLRSQGLPWRAIANQLAVRLLRCTDT